MKINVTFNTKPILDYLETLGQSRQGPFILSQTLNLMAKKVQANLRKDFETNLTLRRKSWILQQVKLKDGKWSTKTRLSVTIELTDSATFISPMEEGKDHLPINGKKYLVFPNSKSFGNKIIGRNDLLNVKNLNLHSTPHGTQGNQRTFIINSKATGTPLIMQRVSADAHRSYKKGRSKSTGLRMLYTLIKMSKRPKKINWYSTATNTIHSEFTTTAASVMSQALRDAKKI